MDCEEGLGKRGGARGRNRDRDRDRDGDGDGERRAESILSDRTAELYTKKEEKKKREKKKLRMRITRAESPRIFERI